MNAQENTLKIDYEKTKKGIYVPILKTKGFNPSPTAGKIPFFADGNANFKCIGTQRYMDFWAEEFNRCINGYDTGGLHIPGPYYWFLNHTIVKGLLGPMYPFFNDTQYEVEYMFDQAKKYNMPGIVVLKARRVGLSELNQSGLHWGIRFVEGYKAAVTAGLDRYVQGIRNKFNYSASRYNEALRINILRNNVKEYTIGYEVEDSVGGYREDGYGSQILWETMFDDPYKLEGEYFHEVIMEEGGQYEKLSKVHGSIKPAMEFGGKIGGLFKIYGTAGDILTKSKAFKYFYDNAEKLGFYRMFIKGNRFFFPFNVNPISMTMNHEITNEEMYCIPNIKKKFKGKAKSEVLGMEDTSAADEYLDDLLARYTKLGNKEKIKEWLKARPRSESEAWTSGGNNNFNEEIVMDQLLKIEGRENEFVKPYILEYVRFKNKNGVYELKMPLQVEAIPAKKKDPDWKKVLILEKPIPNMPNLDIGGIDGYNQDQSATSNSLGAMVILRQSDIFPFPGMKYTGKYPIFLYYGRPPKKELFFDICLKASIYYNLVSNVMIAAESDLVISYFIDNQGRKYLSHRPRNFDSPNSKQVHTFGFKVSNNKEQLMGALQGYLEDNYQNIFFTSILKDFLAYDEDYIGSDWDSVDALGCAFVRIIDKRFKSKPEIKKESERIEWVDDGNGNMVPVEGNNKRPAFDDPSVIERKGGFIVLD